jgi:hypothetical protein
MYTYPSVCIHIDTAGRVAYVQGTSHHSNLLTKNEFAFQLLYLRTCTIDCYVCVCVCVCVCVFVDVLVVEGGGGGVWWFYVVTVETGLNVYQD